jgi:hypothetical protein
VKFHGHIKKTNPANARNRQRLIAHGSAACVLSGEPEGNRKSSFEGLGRSEPRQVDGLE